METFYFILAFIVSLVFYALCNIKLKRELVIIGDALSIKDFSAIELKEMSFYKKRKVVKDEMGKILNPSSLVRLVVAGNSLSSFNLCTGNEIIVKKINKKLALEDQIKENDILLIQIERGVYKLRAFDKFEGDNLCTFCNREISNEKRRSYFFYSRDSICGIVTYKLAEYKEDIDIIRKEQDLYIKRIRDRVSIKEKSIKEEENIISDLYSKIERENEISKKIVLYTHIINIDSNDAEAYFKRSVLKEKTGDKDGALKDYDRAIKLNPNYAKSYQERNDSKTDSDDEKGSLKDKEKEIEPIPIIPYNNKQNDLDSLHSALKDDDMANISNYIIKYVTGNNQHPIPWFIKNRKKDLDDKKDGIKDYDKANKQDTTFAEKFFKRGNWKREFGDLLGALSDYDMAIEINPSYTEAFFKRGDLKRDLGDLLGALFDYNKGIEISYNNRNNMGLLENKDNVLRTSENDIANNIIFPQYY